MTVKSDNAPEAGAERVAVEQPAGDGANVAKALEHVNQIIDKIATVAKAAPASAPAVPESDSDDAPETTPDPEDADVEKAMTAAGMLKAAGLSGEAYKAALEKLKKAGVDPAMKMPMGKPPFAAKTKKAEESEGGDEPLTAEALQTAISKAKVFTPARIAKLNEAIETLKLLVESVAPGSAPKTKAPTSPSFGASGVTALTKAAKALAGEDDSDEEPTEKSAATSEVAALGGLVDKGFSAMADVLKSLGESMKELKQGLDKTNGEVDSIKKARPASNALPSDETETNTQKSGSLWSGVL